MSADAPMKLFLDSCVIDWLADDPRGPALFEKFQTGELQGAIFPEVAKELNDIPAEKADRRAKLMTVLRPLLPVQLSLVPVSGLERSGACRTAPTGASELREELKKLGIRKLDVLHLMNAHSARCQVFLTTDQEDILRRKNVLERRLGFEILRPSEFLDRLESKSSS